MFKVDNELREEEMSCFILVNLAYSAFLYCRSRTMRLKTLITHSGVISLIGMIVELF